MNSNMKLIDEFGNEVECEIIGTFYSDETDQCYIVYKTNEKDENNEYKIYGSRYTMKGDKLITEGIEEEREWDIIDEYLANL